MITPAAMLLVLGACNPPPSQADLDATRGGRVEVYFNDPGTSLDNMVYPDAIDVQLELIEGATDRIDMAVMGFTYEPLIQALVAAYDRGVDIRMVGDAGHLTNYGYEAFLERRIPMVVGNLNHIMHDKFMVVDGRFLWAGTANWSTTDLIHNSNNFIFIDSPDVAADFTAEFEQMFVDGLFGHNKNELDNGRSYQVGDTTVEVWFSPNEDAMGRILEYVDGARESLRFTIFAFTKDQVGSAFIRKQAEFDALDAADGISPDADFRDRRSIAGVVDQSQLHSNGQYHEVYRLLAAGVPMRLDGIDSSKQPGDYQAGGGRLHSKTMVIDAYGDEPLVISGSFNWSSSATVSNDEFLLVMKSERIARQYDDYFEQLWTDAKKLGESFVSEGDVAPGDIVINEVMWYGVNSGDDEGYDEFIELRNTTDQLIDLDMWQIANPDDFVVGLPPGSYIEPNGTFLIVDHVLEPYEDGAPQDEHSAYTSGDLVVNAFNDNRQSRLYLKDGALELFLQDPEAAIVDVAGDGGAAFAGGPDGSRVRSMERRAVPGDGADPASWYACTLEEGTGVVNPDYVQEILATPGVENSPEP